MSGMLFTVASRAKDFVVNAVKNMSEEERRSLALTLIGKKLGWVVAHNLTLFTNLGYRIAERLITEDADHVGQVMRHLAVFGLTEDEKRALFIVTVNAGKAWALKPALHEFPLDAGFAKKLISAGYERLVGEHLALFKGYGEQQFHEDRLVWQTSFDLRRAPGHRYKA